jgi:hypothetical protein
MADILPPVPVDAPFGSYNWTDWYKKVRDAINAAETISWSAITGTPTTLSGYGITNAQNGIQFQDEGSNLGSSGSATTVDFTGTGVTASRAGNTVTVNITGGGGDWTYLQLLTDFDTDSATAVDVTGLGFTPIANKTYIVECGLMVETDDVTVGVKPGVSWPGGLNNGVAKLEVTTSATASAIKNLNFGADGEVDGTGLPAINTSYPAFINSSFITGGSPTGTFQITLAKE